MRAWRSGSAFVFALASAALLCLALCACSASGSGGSQSTSAPPETQTSAPEPAPTSEPPTSPVAGQTVLAVLDDDMQAIYANRDTALPVAVEFFTAGEGGVTVFPAYGEEAVNQTLDAIAQIVITGETDMVAEDDSSAYIFIAEDGSTAGSVSFNMDNLTAGRKIYTVENTGALATLPFPAAFHTSSIFTAIPDPALVEFLARCEAGDAIASVTVTADGQSKTTAEKGAVEEAAFALLYADIGYAEEMPDTHVSAFDLTFAMEDGTEYRFSFADGFYIYEFPEPLGAWGYYNPAFKELAGIAG